MIEKSTIKPLSKAIAVVPGPRTSYLDHIIPLCHLWQIPLLCTDAWVYTCANTFYPPTEVFLANHTNFQGILSHYETFVTVDPCRIHPNAFQFGEFFYRGKGRTVAGFHGNPLKFRDEYWIEKYADDDVVLVYGSYLIEYFKEKGVWERLQEVNIIGNVRKKFYEANKFFFDGVIKPHLFPNKKRKTLLWAPTWSFPATVDDCRSIISLIPEEYQVIVKLHPFMYRLYPEETEELKFNYAADERVLFLGEIPLIYPLLQDVDIYLGDDSSVAFDFLSFDRPLFFIGEKKHSWGTDVANLKMLSDLLRQKDELSMPRKTMYAHVFSS